ncbi:Zinc finger protein 395 [Camelus dromedarius]|uniref:Zinc finger protein 395 n=1 Tax=Camelus dromedarius TaxID=9838 RepID=A0A5N4CAP0_CAMDR|nr:Zinc finger protein 395 [Camelus dromedarius]KAB1255986.1 Zinc finger protein 395 [Camelus dromedarius]
MTVCPLCLPRNGSSMASVLSRRLGKRSLLGARVLGPPGAAPPLEPQAELLEGVAPQPFLASKDTPCQEQPKEVLKAPGTSRLQQVAFQPGQKVCVWYGGQERAGLVERHSWAEDKVTVWLLDQKLQICCKAEEVWLAELPGPIPQVPEQGTQAPAYRPVSRNIDVPKRKSDAVEMDEMMAAMVLTSLSCSPVVQSPPAVEANFSGEDGGPGGVWARQRSAVDFLCPEQLIATVTGLAAGFLDVGLPFDRPPSAVLSTLDVAFCSPSRAACDPWKESGDVSDSGSSTTSGHWSGSSGVSTPSPPHPQASPKYLGDAFGSPQTDNGFETDPDAFLLDEPAPRKRKNSVKVMYKCLWPNCGKVLRSIVGIKRHVKALHLGDTVDSDQFKREEDFYYTEVQMKEEAAAPAGAPAADPAPAPSMTSPPLAVLSPPPPKAQPSGPEHPGLESYLPSAALSKSAPGSFWHIQADHAYQALPSFQIPVSPHIYTSISWAAAPSTASSLSPVRSRSLSFSEPQQPPPAVKSHLIVTSPPRAQSSARKTRGEAKKCRKVYGIEHRDQWCTACRWKKACQRFLD